MPSNLDTLRRVHALALRSSILGPVDLDLAAEAGMDGNLARLLQAARDLDADAEPVEGPREEIMRAYAQAGFVGALVPVDVDVVPAPQPVTLRPGVDVHPTANASPNSLKKLPFVERLKTCSND